MDWTASQILAALAHCQVAETIPLERDPPRRSWFMGNGGDLQSLTSEFQLVRQLPFGRIPMEAIEDLLEGGYPIFTLKVVPSSKSSLSDSILHVYTFLNSRQAG